MQDLEPPFQFDLSALLQKARRTFQKRVEGVSISLPFVSFSVRLEDREKRVAREVVIRLADRRVLNAFECCDGCIDQALASLQEIRSLLVDQQVALADLTDGPLYLLREGIRQFLTFEQQFGAGGAAGRPSDSHRRHEDQALYFAGLEALRAHLHRSLIQVAAIADVEIPGIADHMRYGPVGGGGRVGNGSDVHDRRLHSQAKRRSDGEAKEQGEEQRETDAGEPLQHGRCRCAMAVRAGRGVVSLPGSMVRCRLLNRAGPAGLRG
jgi:hypothetical protein